MKSIFSFRGKEPPKPKEVVAEREAAREADESSSTRGRGGGAGREAAGNGGGRQKLKPEDRIAPGARTEEDDLLDALSGSVARLKTVAHGIGDEIGRQDKTLDTITTGVDRVEGKVKKATTDARKLAR